MRSQDPLLAEIRSFCLAHADAKQVARYARYFKEGYDAYGLSQAVFERQRDEWLKVHRDRLGLEGFVKLGDRLVQSGKYEEASFAIGFLVPFSDRYTPEIFQRVGAWLDEGLRNWAHTDVLCGQVLASSLKQGVVSVQNLAAWRTAASKWKRRAVPVTLLALVKEPDRVPSLLRFLDPMMSDPERVVHQGLGWFLREAWKVKPNAVESFLLRWKDTAARLIFQYATEKMSAGQKARFRAETSKGRKARTGG